MLSNNGYGVKDKLLLVMTQEEKQLLLVDLCARMPYGVKISVNDRIVTLEGIHVLDTVAEYDSCLSSDIEDVKPYLFPMSSMTEEQKKEEYEICKYYLNGYESKLIDFYHKNHLDYRGLISMGLAIDCTNLNIY